MAAGYAKPLCLERVLASRTVPPVELFELAQSWGQSGQARVSDLVVAEGEELERGHRPFGEGGGEGGGALGSDLCLLEPEAQERRQAAAAEAVAASGSRR